MLSVRFQRTIHHERQEERVHHPDDELTFRRQANKRALQLQLTLACQLQTLRTGMFHQLLRVR